MRLRVVCAALLAAVASGCGTASPSPETFGAIEPAEIASMREGYPSRPGKPELDYARGTAEALFRQRPAEYSRDFVPTGDLPGYGLCLRSSAQAGFDHVLIIWQRPLTGGPISQAEDDAQVFTRGRPIERCRDRDVGYASL